MSWADSWYGDANVGWFTGVAQQAPNAVPQLLPVSIGTHSYVVEASKYKRSTVQALRPGMDQSPEPGEVSLNNEGLWRRSQSDWRLGSNQLMFDENGSVRNRYWTGKGVNPHPDTPANAFQLRMHKDVQQVRTSGHSNLRIIAAPPNIYIVDGTDIFWTNALNGGSTVWTSSGMSAATGAANIIDVTFDGAYVYATVGAGGIYRTANGSTSSQQFNAFSRTLNQCMYANGVLFVAANNVLMQMNSAGQVDGDTFGNLGTLTSTLSTGGPITALPCTPCQLAIPAGTTITLSSGGHTQTNWTVGPAAVPYGATSINVTSNTPTFAFPQGTALIATNLTASSGLLLYPHPNPAFTWQEALTTPHGIFLTGNSGASGEMLQITPDSSTGALTAPASMFILPDGEQLNDMCYYSGAIILATSRGVRVAVVQISFVLSVTYGPVILIPGGVNAVFGYGEFAWFAWSDYDAVSTGMGRLDLARFAADETPSMSSDILAGTAAAPVQGNVTSVCNFVGTRVFAVAGLGVWTEHPTNYVASATIDVGKIKFGTTEHKLPVYVDLWHDPLPLGASISVSAIDQYGTVHVGGNSSAQGSIGPTPFMVLNDSAPGEIFELVFTITNGTDPTNPPVLHRWTLYALVTPKRVDQIIVPIILYREDVGRLGEGADLYFDTLAEWQYLKSLEATGTPVVYREGDNVETVYVDQVEMDADRWDPVDHHWFEGICQVSLITLGAGQ